MICSHPPIRARFHGCAAMRSFFLLNPEGRSIAQRRNWGGASFKLLGGGPRSDLARQRRAASRRRALRWRRCRGTEGGRKSRWGKKWILVHRQERPFQNKSSCERGRVREPFPACRLKISDVFHRFSHCVSCRGFENVPIYNRSSGIRLTCQRGFIPSSLFHLSALISFLLLFLGCRRQLLLPHAEPPDVLPPPDLKEGTTKLPVSAVSVSASFCCSDTRDEDRSGGGGGRSPGAEGPGVGGRGKGARSVQQLVSLSVWLRIQRRDQRLSDDENIKAG